MFFYLIQNFGVIFELINTQIETTTAKFEAQKSFGIKYEFYSDYL